MATVRISPLSDNSIEISGSTQEINNAISAPGIIPTGAIFYFSNNTIPLGYLKANGAAVSRGAYSALFSAIGTLYGSGDGATTFNLPDLRGDAARCWDDSRGVDSGRAIGTFQDQSWKTWWVTERGAGWNTGYTHTLGQVPQSAVNAYYGNQFTGQWSNPSGAQQYRYGTEQTFGRNRALLACIKY